MATPSDGSFWKQLSLEDAMLDQNIMKISRIYQQYTVSQHTYIYYAITFFLTYVWNNHGVHWPENDFSFLSYQTILDLRTSRVFFMAHFLVYDKYKLLICIVRLSTCFFNNSDRKDVRGKGEMAAAPAI